MTDSEAIAIAIENGWSISMEPKDGGMALMCRHKDLPEEHYGIQLDMDSVRRGGIRASVSYLFTPPDHPRYPLGNLERPTTEHSDE